LGLVLKKIHDGLDKISEILGSRGFYGFVLGLFVFQSLWIAFSALYPQAFDENFHFGLIKVYSHYWLPFLTKQPPNAYAYGAVARDPSYLYHYLMSFPYRLMALFIHAQTAQVIILRVMDIGLFLIGLEIFRRVLIKAKVSKALTNVILLIFILIPIVPQLAGQISYDDMLFPLIAWICLQALHIIDDIKRHKLSSIRLFILAITIILTGIEKYASLPISLAVVVYIAYELYVNYQPKLKVIWQEFKADFIKNPAWLKWLLIIGLIISIGMFLERDGVNLVEYHRIAPSCAKVLSVNQCKPYSAWYATYARHEYLIEGKTHITFGLIRYIGQWFYWMWYRLFFAVNGPKSNFASKGPLPIPSVVAIILAVVSLIALIIYRKKVFRKNPYAKLLFSVAVFYCLILFIQGYLTYNYTAVLENMNGRYLIPILLPLAAVLGPAFSYAMHRSGISKALAAIIIIFLFLQGGGLFTFILRSNHNWYWSNDTIVKINEEARKVAKRVIIKHKS
jgi:hypothetical protein